jgi:hypothetical protein
MNNTPASPTEERIELLVSELSATRRWTNFNSNLILLCAYFGFFYYTFNDLSRPDRIVAAARAYVEDVTPEARQMAAKEIQKSAPIWAREISSEIISSLPNMREQAEVAVNHLIDDQIRQVSDRTSVEFDRMVSENRDELGKAIDTLVDKQDSQEFVTRVMPIFEKEYVPGLKYDSVQIVGVLDDLKQRFTKLAAGKDLNPVEQQMRYIMGLTRYVRETQAPHTVE